MKSVLILLFLMLSGITKAQAATQSMQITLIEEGVYMHTSYRHVEGFGLVDSNGLVVIVENQAYIIDTPWSSVDTQKLITWIKDKGFKLQASLSTHSHADRTAGIGLLNSKSIPTYTSVLTHELLKAEGRPTATHTFEDSLFWLKQDQIQAFYAGAGHTSDNIVVWLPEHRILFGGCLMRSLTWSRLGNLENANVDAWSNTITAIQNQYPDIKIVVPGHGALGNSEILSHTRELVEAALTR